MPTIGPYYPGTEANDDSNGGTVNWSTGNAGSDNDSPDEAAFAPGAPSPGTFEKTKWLFLTNFGISSGDLPDGNIIDEINFEIERKCDFNEFGATNTYVPGANGRLIVAGAIAGTSEVIGSPTTSYAVFGPWNLMLGVTPTPAQIRASTFGLAIEYENFDDSTVNANKVYVDFVRISSIVFHAAPAGGHKLCGKVNNPLLTGKI